MSIIDGSLPQLLSLALSFILVSYGALTFPALRLPNTTCLVLFFWGVAISGGIHRPHDHAYINYFSGATTFLILYNTKPKKTTALILGTTIALIAIATRWLGLTPFYYSYTMFGLASLASHHALIAPSRTSFALSCIAWITAISTLAKAGIAFVLSTLTDYARGRKLWQAALLYLPLAIATFFVGLEFSSYASFHQYTKSRITREDFRSQHHMRIFGISDGNRIAMWSGLLQTYTESSDLQQLFGKGDSYVPAKKLNTANSFTTNHNVALTLLLNYGAIGLMAYALATAHVLIALRRTYFFWQACPFLALSLYGEGILIAYVFTLLSGLCGALQAASEPILICPQKCRYSNRWSPFDKTRYPTGNNYIRM